MQKGGNTEKDNAFLLFSLFLPFCQQFRPTANLQETIRELFQLGYRSDRFDFRLF